MTLVQLAEGLLGLGMLGVAIIATPVAIAEPTPIGEMLVLGVGGTGLSLISDSFKSNTQVSTETAKKAYRYAQEHPEQVASAVKVASTFIKNVR